MTWYFRFDCTEVSRLKCIVSEVHIAGRESSRANQIYPKILKRQASKVNYEIMCFKTNKLYRELNEILGWEGAGNRQLFCFFKA
jgi:hypothetical protein